MRDRHPFIDLYREYHEPQRPIAIWIVLAAVVFAWALGLLLESSG